MGSTDRAQRAEREVPKSSPGYGRHQDICHLPLQSQGHWRSPDKKSCPSVPCLPPSVQTPASGGFPLPWGHSCAPDEHPAETSWMGKPARGSCLLALKKHSGNSSLHASQEARAEGFPQGTVLSGCSSPFPSPRLPAFAGLKKRVCLTRKHLQSVQGSSHLPLKIQTLSEMGCWTTYRWDSVLCPDVVNPIWKNATPHLMLEEAQRP